MTKFIKIEGDFITEKALHWKNELNTLARKKMDISIDMTEVLATDIVGVNALATTQKVCNAEGRKLVVSLKKTGELFQLLHLTKFTEVLSLNLF